MSKRIDMNCDMGESFGAYTIGSDEELMKWITSANIACGAHAGDPHVMDRMVKLAKKHQVSIGAHPGYPDLAGFGRRAMTFTAEEIYQLVISQIGSLQAICKVNNVSLRHVKPHGALYNLAAKDRDVANAIAQAVYDLDPNLVLFGLAGSELLEAGRGVGLPVASEVFADRTYQADGSLTPRSNKNALIEDIDTAVTQVERMVMNGVVNSTNGEVIQINADTVCIHGDGADPVGFVKSLSERLKQVGVEVVSFSKDSKV